MNAEKISVASKKIVKENPILFKMWLYYAILTFVFTLIINIVQKEIVSHFLVSLNSNILFHYFLLTIIKGFIISLFTTPFLIGYIHCMFNIINKQAVEFSEIFKFYKKPSFYFKSILINFIIISINSLLTSSLSYLKVLTETNKIIEILLICLLFIASLIISALLFLCNYIFAIYPEYSIIAIFKKSIVMMSRKILNYYDFLLTFVGWWALAAIILGVASYVLCKIIFKTGYDSILFYVISGLFGTFMYGIGFFFLPYYNLCLTLYAKDFLPTKQKKKQIK